MPTKEWNKKLQRTILLCETGESEHYTTLQQWHGICGICSIISNNDDDGDDWDGDDDDGNSSNNIHALASNKQQICRNGSYSTYTRNVHG